MRTITIDVDTFRLLLLSASSAGAAAMMRADAASPADCVRLANDAGEECYRRYMMMLTDNGLVRELDGGSALDAWRESARVEAARRRYAGDAMPERAIGATVDGLMLAIHCGGNLALNVDDALEFEGDADPLRA